MTSPKINTLSGLPGSQVDLIGNNQLPGKRVLIHLNIFIVSFEHLSYVIY